MRFVVFNNRFEIFFRTYQRDNDLWGVEFI